MVESRKGRKRALVRITLCGLGAQQCCARTVGEDPPSQTEGGAPGAALHGELA